MIIRSPYKFSCIFTIFKRRENEQLLNKLAETK